MTSHQQPLRSTNRGRTHLLRSRFARLALLARSMALNVHC